MTFNFCFEKIEEKPHRCHAGGCSAVAGYLLRAISDRTEGRRLFCARHGEEAANRLGIPFPPIKKEETK